MIFFAKIADLAELVCSKFVEKKASTSRDVFLSRTHGPLTPFNGEVKHAGYEIVTWISKFIELRDSSCHDREFSFPFHQVIVKFSRKKNITSGALQSPKISENCFKILSTR